MMQQHNSRWTDERLLSILDETGSWTITGASGDVIGMVASLRRALEASAHMGDQRVVALARRPADEIIVFEGQIERLTARMLRMTG